MSDNRHRYQTIRRALKRLYPQEPQGNLARQLNTLAALISGIVGSKSTNLPHIAGKVPDGTKPESRVKKFARWVQNQGITAELYYLPFIEALLTGLAAQGPLLLAIDGSVVGRGCVVLLVQGTKGHFPEAPPGQLVEQLHALGPPGALVIFLGDGEFDGVTLQAAVQDYHWAYVCRTARNVCLTEEGVSFTFADLPVEPGDCLGVPEVLFTQEEYGPVLAIAQ